MPSVVAAVALAALHAAAGALPVPGSAARSRWLSAGGGVALAYVFVHLLPWLADVQDAVEETGVLGWLESHVYLIALGGVVTFYALAQLARRSKSRPDSTASDTAGWVRIASYTAYNALIGYVLAQPDLRHGSSLWLFAIAMGVHFLLNDAELRQHHGDLYRHFGRWIVSAAVVGGWALGRVAPVGRATLGLPLAFIAGGVILNVMKEELPEDRNSQLLPFVGAGAAYAAILVLL